MEAFLVSIATISIAEMGDRTQLLSLILAARYRRPLPIIAGILLATLANHAAAGFAGHWFGNLLRPRTLEVCVALSMIAMALWTLKPDKLDQDEYFVIGDNRAVSVFGLAKKSQIVGRAVF